MDEPLPDRCRVEAWQPGIPGITEVFHARMVDYAYPPHCHDTWTVLIVDSGAITYDLDSRHRDASGPTVTVLPPGVIHDGRPADGAPGFRKRNLYLEGSFLPESMIGAAVDRTNLHDPALRDGLATLHDALAAGEGPLDGEARLALIGERIAAHLAPRTAAARRPPEGAVADRLRQLLDAHLTEHITLRDAAAVLDRSVPHLVRSFTRTYGVSPHAYVIGRRIDLARGLLLSGARPADVAADLGFHDQAHLTRHFRRHTSVTPARYARSHA
ncbi:MAG TPA: AraC family transcriptional regulator [Pseudonocardia sp.]|nr:AraC family transcriptional regulator [Pseudonocardia sp.]